MLSDHTTKQNQTLRVTKKCAVIEVINVGITERINLGLVGT